MIYKIRKVLYDGNMRNVKYLLRIIIITHFAPTLVMAAFALDGKPLWEGYKLGMLTNVGICVAILIAMIAAWIFSNSNFPFRKQDW